MTELRASKISLVLADVDGTLVTEDKVLTARARAAVKALQADLVTASNDEGFANAMERLILDHAPLISPAKR
jgi:hydroxymethylpyrimidine pyrophosphatase-like HAD family hydrolase